MRPKDKIRKMREDGKTGLKPMTKIQLFYHLRSKMNLTGVEVHLKYNGEWRKVSSFGDYPEIRIITQWINV